MNCEDLKEFYELYALDLLEEAERGEIDAHLARGCEACRKGVRDAVAMNTVLMSAADEVKPPARLKRRVMGAVGGQQSSSFGDMVRSPWSWVLAMAAAAAFLFAVRTSIEQRHVAIELAEARVTIEQVSGDREQMMKALSFLNQPETQQVGFGKDKPAHGNIFVHPNRGVLLIASNLPALTAGQLFEMWVIPPGGAPRPAGMFRSTESGTAFHMLSSGMTVSSGDAIAVTIEPEAGSAAPTTTPLFVQAI